MIKHEVGVLPGNQIRTEIRYLLHLEKIFKLINRYTIYNNKKPSKQLYLNTFVGLQTA